MNYCRIESYLGRIHLSFNRHRSCVHLRSHALNFNPNTHIRGRQAYDHAPNSNAQTFAAILNAMASETGTYLF